MLCIHMDTVYEATHSFQTCTWLDDHTLNGPGVADAKGGAVVMLNTLLALEQSSLAGKIGWEVILNPDEDRGLYPLFGFFVIHLIIDDCKLSERA